MHTCGPRTWEVEAGGLWVQGQPGLHSQAIFVPSYSPGNKKSRIYMWPLSLLSFGEDRHGQVGGLSVTIL